VTPEPAEPRPGRRPHPAAAAQEAAKPDADGLTGQREPGSEPPARLGRRAKRLAKPAHDLPEADRPPEDGRPAAAAASDTGHSGRPSARHKLSKRGRPVREEPPGNAATRDETPQGEAAKTETPKDALSKDEPAKAGTAKPGDETKSDADKTEAVKAEGMKLLRDPVPAVTPAPKPSEGEAKPAQAPTASITSVPSASERSAGPVPAAKPAAPAMDDAAPPSAPVPASPPTPPISQ